MTGSVTPPASSRCRSSSLVARCPAQSDHDRGQKTELLPRVRGPHRVWAGGPPGGDPQDGADLARGRDPGVIRGGFLLRVCLPGSRGAGGRSAEVHQRESGQSLLHFLHHHRGVRRLARHHLGLRPHREPRPPDPPTRHPPPPDPVPGREHGHDRHHHLLVLLLLQTLSLLLPLLL